MSGTRSTLRRAGRKRRGAAWTLLTLGALTAAVWAASRWWSVGAVTGSGGVFAVAYGTVWIGAPGSGSASFGKRWNLRTLPVSQWDLWFGWTSTMGPRGTTLYYRGVVVYLVEKDGSIGTVKAALWPLPVALCLAGAPLLWSGVAARRRARIGACASCGYPRAGLAAGAPCPECGSAGG